LSNSAKILVTFALLEEGYPFVRKLIRRSRKEGVIFGGLRNIEVAVCCLGIGLENSDRFSRVVSDLQPRLVINSGFAGAVLSLLKAGDFVLAKNFSSLEPSAGFRGLFSASGDFLTVSEIAGPEMKSRLQINENVLAIDMESARVARVCRQISIPLLTARMISDRSDEALPVVFTGKRIRGAHDIFHAIRFAVRMLILRQKLAARLERLIEALAASLSPGS
jgi:nucleoside phosphorylase